MTQLFCFFPEGHSWPFKQLLSSKSRCDPIWSNWCAIFFVALGSDAFGPKLPWRKGSKWEFSGNRERKDVWWFRLVTTWRRCYNSYINVTFYFFDSGSLAMMAMAFIFKTWDLLSTDPSNLHRRGSQRWTEERIRKKRNAFFRGNLLWCLKRSKIWLRSIFCPKK